MTAWRKIGFIFGAISGDFFLSLAIAVQTKSRLLSAKVNSPELRLPVLSKGRSER